MWKHSIKIRMSCLASTKWWIRKLELFSAFSLKQTVAGNYFHGCKVVKYIMRFRIILKLCSRIKDFNPRFTISIWPFSSSLMPLFQNESTHRTNLSYEIDFVFHEHERSFHMNGFTQGFVLTQAKGNLKIAYSASWTTRPRWLTFKIGSK